MRNQAHAQLSYFISDCYSIHTGTSCIPHRSGNCSMAYSEPTPRQGCVSVTINSKVYVWGGKTSSGDTSHLSNLYIFDIGTEKWQAHSIAGQHPPGFFECAAAQFANKLYVYGGVNEKNRNTRSLYCLDLDLLLWKELLSSYYYRERGPMPKHSCGMVVHDDKIYIFGGFSVYKVTNELHVFIPTTGMYLTS